MNTYLTADEEIVLLAQYKRSKDKRVLERLIGNSLKAIYKKAHSISKIDEVRQDLVSEGVIGFINCLDNYNDDKNCKFSTYAINCACFAMLTHVKRSSDPFSLAIRGDHYSQIINRLGEKDTTHWTHTDLKIFAKEHHFVLDQVLTVWGTRHFVNSDTLDSAEDSFTRSPEDDCILLELAELAEQILTTKEKDCLDARYFSKEKLPDVSSKYGAQERMIKIIAEKAYNKLIKMLE